MEYSSQKDELLLELQECREDERNSRMEILGAFTAGETILGVLFGASFLEIDNMSIYIRCIFYICIIVFLAVISYVIVLGIDNILRHYYMKDIEKRLNIMNLF